MVDRFFLLCFKYSIYFEKYRRKNMQFVDQILLLVSTFISFLTQIIYVNLFTKGEENPNLPFLVLVQMQWEEIAVRKSTFSTSRSSLVT